MSTIILILSALCCCSVIDFPILGTIKTFENFEKQNRDFRHLVCLHVYNLSFQGESSMNVLQILFSVVVTLKILMYSQFYPTRVQKKDLFAKIVIFVLLKSFNDSFSLCIFLRKRLLSDIVSYSKINIWLLFFFL